MYACAQYERLVPVEEEGTRPARTGPRDGCEPPWGCWECNLPPLQETQILLAANPFL